MSFDIFGIRRRQEQREADEQARLDRAAAIGSLIEVHGKLGLGYDVNVSGPFEATVLSLDPLLVQPHGLFRRPRLVGKAAVKQLLEVTMTEGERSPFMVVEAPNGVMYGNRIGDATLDNLDEVVGRGQAYLDATQ